MLHGNICARQWPLWANWQWLGLPHHRHILHASFSLLRSPNFNKKHWHASMEHKRHARTHARNQPCFMGLKATEGFLWCGWHFWTSMTNVLWPVILLPSVPCCLELLSGEVEPHYFSTTWESLPPFLGEIWQLLNRSVLLSPYCGQCWTATVWFRSAF